MITGASGLIGNRLTELLLQKGHQVSHLSRKSRSDTVPSYEWDVENGILDPNVFKGIDTIVHLAGAGIADKPWTESRKNEILKSRTQSTELLNRVLLKGNHEVRTVVAASAVGFYGFGTSEEEFTESSPAGSDFLATVTKKWEASVDRLKSTSIRLVKLRIGIVLSEKGGALKPMVLPVKFYVGAPLGTGKQLMSWIHIDDLCAMFIYGIENESCQGVYNAVGPSAASNQEVTETLAAVLHRPLFLPKVPSFLLKFLLGEMAVLVLQGSRVSSQKIQQLGFQFQFSTLQNALTDLLTKRE